jgi:hypothetical protein
MPDSANLILPSTWALKIKQYLDGNMWKHKARSSEPRPAKLFWSIYDTLIHNYKLQSATDL